MLVLIVGVVTSISRFDILRTIYASVERQKRTHVLATVIAVFVFVVIVVVQLNKLNEGEV